jgi:UDP-N-acetylmuramate-alanine ligase
MNLEHVKKIYFIGLGGIGMSAAAGLAREQGFEVAGSDATTVYPPAKDVLIEHDIEVGIGYDAARIAASNADLFVVSSGEDEHNPEVKWLLDNGKEYVSFCELLYHLSQDKLRIVVSGTHGKSTTSGLLGHLLKRIDDSSYMVGAVLKADNTNFYSGAGHYIVFEGDEYKSTFDDNTPKMHYYKGDILVLTNLEFDHPDMFADLDETKGEFRQLVADLPDDGVVVYNADNQNLADVVYREGKRAFTFSVHNSSDMQATDVIYSEHGAIFTVVNKLDPDNTRTERYETALPGEINVYNALASRATLRALGFQPELIQQHLLTYTGVKRRFDVLTPPLPPMGEGGTASVPDEGSQGIIVVDDYAHHPTAVRETLEATRQRYFGAQSVGASFSRPQQETGGQGQPLHNASRNPRLWAIFEPHTYSRTRATIHELAESFGPADQVLLAPMYAAREKGSNPGITDDEVLTSIKAHQPNIRLVKDKQDAFDILKAEAKPGDVIVVMAVGSFNHLAYELAEWLSNKA